MKAMILAAGVGERMLPLTRHTPKPLLTIGGTPLIEHHIVHLAAAGFSQLVINVSHLAAQIMDYCGDGERWGVSIDYSLEEQPLETAGGIFNALPRLGAAPFLIVNGDIWFDAPFDQLRHYRLRDDELAHLLMVDNPPQHPQGDFWLDDQGWIRQLSAGTHGLTYAGVGLYCAQFFGAMSAGKLPLRPLLDTAIDGGRLGGQYCSAPWQDVGTPQRLMALDEQVGSGR